ncbi:hypothetical protein BU26DRAFT_561140 [Trematosphaeria pertusa]|uniref:Uncharacterized protein n=1 Tax=Trematosphaeria pertusa TaxID=390896 RepID=A0A6A6IVD2_9PLEO|nr:uncharacterized protein BU26DRAFT_561140 [Trematosphaeria pertusa]KAF2253872.1 hypothetical protein BU26DRAFT_561140 [Trematosphaeria pertusa]
MDSPRPVEWVSPFMSKVNALTERKRSRALSKASIIEEEIENGDARARKLRVMARKEEDLLRSEASTRLSGATITEPEAPQPAIRAFFDRPLPASPIGNAFSGEHFWAPSFASEQVGKAAPEALQPPAEAASRLAFDQVLEDIQALASQIAASATPTPEEEVRAAQAVLTFKQEEFAELYEFPSPEAVALRMEQLAFEDKRALATFGIAAREDLDDVNKWLEVDEKTLEFTTVLDHARDSLKILRERRKSREIELSAPALGLVWAGRICEDKVGRVGREEGGGSDEDEEEEYGKVLKSIQEEIGGFEGGSKAEVKLRRKFSERVINRRRMKGKAPSVLDLASWASEIKRMEEQKEEGTPTPTPTPTTTRNASDLSKDT